LAVLAGKISPAPLSLLALGPAYSYHTNPILCAQNTSHLGFQTIIRGTVNFCWFFFKWGIILCATATLVGGFLFYQQFDEQLRRGVQDKLAAAYPNLNVHVNHARLVKRTADQAGGVEIRGISISEPRAAGPQPELLYVEELFLQCESNLQDIVLGNLEIDFIRVREPVLRMTRRPDGSWSGAKLLPIPKLSTSPPKGRIEGGTIEVVDPSKAPLAMLTLRDAHLQFDPIPGLTDGSRRMKLRGQLAGDHLQRVELHGEIDPDSKQMFLRGAVEGLAITPGLAAALPQDCACAVESLQAVRGNVDMSFHLETRAAPQPVLYAVSGSLHNGRIDHPRLPLPLTSVETDFKCSNSGCQIDSFVARSGDTELKLCGRCDGPGASSRGEFHLTGQNVVLSESMARRLPSSAGNLAEIWNHFRPEGAISINKLDLANHGDGWKPTDMEITCNDLALTYYRFPYRLEHGQGMLIWKEDRLFTRQFHAMADTEPVEIEMNVVHPGPEWTGQLRAHTKQLPINPKLLHALPGRAQEVMTSMRPWGTMECNLVQERRDPHLEPQQTIDIDLLACRMSYDKFPYPLENIHGHVHAVGTHWEFQQLMGSKGSGAVQCDGRLDLDKPGDSRLVLNFIGSNIPLDDELRDALAPTTPGAPATWQQLRPRGQINLRSELSYTSAAHKADVSVDVEPLPETSIRPIAFPYRFEQLRGLVRYHDGVAQLLNVQAEHGRSRFSGNGYCKLFPGGGWQLEFAKATADRINLHDDRDLMEAIPDGLRKVAGELHPQGAINAAGKLSLRKGGKSSDLLKSDWDVQLSLHQNEVDAGLKIENIFGNVRLTGGTSGETVFAQGQLDLDSCTYRNYQWQTVRGPFTLDNQKVLLGALCEKLPQGQRPAHVTGTVCAGQMNADARIDFGSPTHFHVQGTLGSADLQLIACENHVGVRQITGRLTGNLNLDGDTRGLHTLSGKGTVHLADANVYELPAMVALLKLITVRPLDTNAFTESDALFKVEGEHILLEKIKFSGDAISLIGDGEMGLDQRVNLTFHAMVGRSEGYLPMVQNLLGEASSQMMQIHVTGPIDDPHITRDALPGWNNAVKQINGAKLGGDASQGMSRAASRMKEMIQR
jgi:hypothetical protein